jgi:hypothetical protein
MSEKTGLCKRSRRDPRASAIWYHKTYQVFCDKAAARSRVSTQDVLQAREPFDFSRHPEVAA